MKDVTFADLETFVAFARSEHFGQTAAELEVSVATVQRAVRSLERKLGVALVEQSGRRVRMLPAGHVLEREAYAVLRSRQDAISNTRANAGHTTVLRVGHTHSLGLGFVPEVLAELRTAVHGIRFRCWQGTATDVVAALLRGETDVAFTSVAPSERDFVITPLFTESLLLAVPADGPLNLAASVSLAEVRNHSFVAMESGASSRTSMMNACARAGFVPRVTAEGSDLFVVESMVGAGIGLSLVPQGMTDYQHPHVARLLIASPELPDRTVMLVHPRVSPQSEHVQLLSEIAMRRGRVRQESFHRAQ